MAKNNLQSTSWGAALLDFWVRYIACFANLWRAGGVKVFFCVLAVIAQLTVIGAMATGIFAYFRPLSPPIPTDTEKQLKKAKKRLKEAFEGKNVDRMLEVLPKIPSHQIASRYILTARNDLSYAHFYMHLLEKCIREGDSRLLEKSDRLFDRRLVAKKIYKCRDASFIKQLIQTHQSVFLALDSNDKEALMRHAIICDRLDVLDCLLQLDACSPRYQKIQPYADLLLNAYEEREASLFQGASSENRAYLQAEVEQRVQCLYRRNQAESYTARFQAERENLSFEEIFNTTPPVRVQSPSV